MKALRATLDNLSLRELKASVQSLHAASAHKDLLAGINTSLVLVDQTLINTASGQYRQLDHTEGLTSAAALARCAALLLQGRTVQPSVLLLLPPAEFVATRFSMGITGEKMLRSALKLQVHSLIPACEQPLLLGLHGGSSEGVALWYPEPAAEALFQAFQSEGLLLAALMPRVLALAQVVAPAAELVLGDEDAGHLTRVEVRDGVVRNWLGITRGDLQQDAFATQWQAECARLAGPPAPLGKGPADWTALRHTFAGDDHYCFYPAGAEQVGRDYVARRQRRAASVAAMVLAGVLCLPFLNNWFQILRLERQVEALREASTAARSSQAAVYRIDDEWGAVSGYPRQNVAGVLLTLNELIDSSLSSFTVNKGVVDITGFARDPALLLEQLAEREQFYDVGQSRTSSGSESSERGDRFGIRFSLSDVDFSGYEEQYPVTAQDPAQR